MATEAVATPLKKLRLGWLTSLPGSLVDMSALLAGDVAFLRALGRTESEAH